VVSTLSTKLRVMGAFRLQSRPHARVSVSNDVVYGRTRRLLPLKRTNVNASFELQYELSAVSTSRPGGVRESPGNQA